METKVDAQVFQSLVEGPVKIEITNFIKEQDLKFRNLTTNETQDLIEELIENLTMPLKRSGPDRKTDWDLGWLENFEHYTQSKTMDDLVPRYFGKSPYFRINGNFVHSNSKDFELTLLHALVFHYSNRFLGDSTSLIELGCGTGHNLRFLRNLGWTNPLMGCDWSEGSKRIFEEFQDIDFQFINFFDPNTFPDIQRDAGVLTVASLEQVGESYSELVQFIIEKKVSRIVHIEPIYELTNFGSIPDVLSGLYMKRRGYLSKYLHYLRHLEDNGMIKILLQVPSRLGSKYINGYSVIVWEPAVKT